MENSRVQNAHCHVINSDVAPLKHEEAISHHSEANVALCVAPIPELILVQRHLTVVLDWVILSEHVNR